jgi:hypothetical protein
VELGSGAKLCEKGNKDTPDLPFRQVGDLISPVVCGHCLQFKAQDKLVKHLCVSRRLGG